MAAGGPLGPIQFHHLLGVSGQRPGQPGTVAAGAFDRPHPLTVVLIGQLQELPVAVGGGGHGQVGQDLAGGCGHDRGGVWVCLWVSTPMTTSTESASMAIALCSLPGC
jgi:hypothetical protein